MPPIIFIYLSLSQITRPFERRSRGGGEWRERPRLLWGLCVPVPPFQFTSRGSHGRPPQWGVAPATVIPAGRLEVWRCEGPMKLRHIFLFLLAASAAIARYISSPFPTGSENPVVALMALDAPALLWLAHGWYALMPGVAVFIGGTLFSGVWHVWFESVPRKKQGKGGCPRGRSPTRTRNRPSSSGKRITPSRRGRFPTRIGS